jgi:CheY-like chemotaxis protein
MNGQGGWPVRLLIPEDERRMATLLKRGLEEDGYAIDLVGTGPDAHWMGQERDYDAIVLDVMLPRMDRLEVCRRLRTAHRWAPIILLTARTALADRVRGLDTWPMTIWPSHSLWRCCPRGCERWPAEDPARVPRCWSTGN